MKVAGYLLFLIGIVGSSWFAARPVTVPEEERTGEDGNATGSDRLTTWASQAAIPFAGGLLFMLGGAFVVRAASRARIGGRTDPELAGPYRGGAGTPPDELDDYRGQLRRMKERLAALSGHDAESQRKALHDGLDELLEELVPAFLAHRQQLIQRLGLGRLAELMSHFAIMERSAARAWSALTDESWDEVAPCLERARLGIDEACRLIELRLGGPAAAA